MASSSLCPACGEGKEASDSLCQGCVEAVAVTVTQDDDDDEEDEPVVVVARLIAKLDLSSTPGTCHASADAASEDVTPIKPALSEIKAAASVTPDSTQRRLAFDDDEDRVARLTIKTPGKLIQEKFLEACAKGQVIELLLSQESPSSPNLWIIVDVQTSEDRISGRVEQATAGSSRTPDSSAKQARSLVLKSNTSPNDTTASLLAATGSPQATVTARHEGEGSLSPLKLSASKKERERVAGEKKLCSMCDTTVEEWMDWCKRCYAVRQREISPSKGPGKCRLCTGVTQYDWQQYCSKCYEAKQRDGAQRKRTAIPAADVNTPFVPYTCTECGGECSASWMRLCGLCYEKSPVSKRPKLVYEKKK